MKGFTMRITISHISLCSISTSSYIGYTAIVGEEASPGMAKLLQLLLMGRGLEWQLINGSIRGRLDVARAGLKAARVMRTSSS